MYSKLQELYGQRTEGVRASALSKELAIELYGKYIQVVTP